LITENGTGELQPVAESWKVADEKAIVFYYERG